VGFYVPVSNANTFKPDGYMTNNVEVDNRGFIYATDRNVSGWDIRSCTARRKRSVLEGTRITTTATTTVTTARTATATMTATATTTTMTSGNHD